MTRGFHVAWRLVLCVALGAPALSEQLSDAQRSAIRSACRSDYMKVCASVPSGTAASLQCLQQHSGEVSTACQTALPSPAAAATPAAAASPAASSSAAPTPPVTVAAATAGTPPATVPLRPRQEARLLRTDCGTDFHRLCADVSPGGGRGITCLKSHAADLSPPCKSALVSLAPQ